MRDINWHLQNDHVIESESEPIIPIIDFHGYTLLDAFDFAAKYKRDREGVSEGSVGNYDRTKRSIERFMVWKKIPLNFKLRSLHFGFINEFFNYLKIELKLANKSFNNHRTMFHATIQCLIDQNQKLFGGVNPIRVVKFLKTKTKKHAAYSIDQMNMITGAAEKHGDFQFILFIKFIYFTLARPKKEIRLLQVKDIRMHMKRILFVAGNAKTQEQYVGIGKPLAKIIEDSGILNFEPNDYVFTVAGTPGKTPTGKKYFYLRLVKYLEETGLDEVNPDFTLYGFKHTGAIQLYMATKDIKLLQRQCRHTTVSQTDQYLRHLGVFDDFQNLDKLKWK